MLQLSSLRRYVTVGLYPKLKGAESTEGPLGSNEHSFDEDSLPNPRNPLQLDFIEGGRISIRTVSASIGPE